MPSPPRTCQEDGSILTGLPLELLQSIFGLLPNSDIKSLRLTNVYFRRVAPLRLDRVFLSPNPRNVQVCNEIANHDTFRLGVTDIIYDDARIIQVPEDNDPESFEQPHRMYSRLWCPFVLQGLEKHEMHHFEHLDYFEMPDTLESITKLKESRSLYDKLIEEQNEVIRTDADAQAFALALTRFPSLQTVTLTFGSHGDPLSQPYQTPMIRSLPRWFLHPVPRDRAIPPTMLPGRHSLGQWSSPATRNQWRGFRLITRLLAESESSTVSKFVIDTNKIVSAGLNCRIFDESENQDYQNLVTLLSSPAMSHFDLDLVTLGQAGGRWPAFRCNNMRYAFGRNAHLQHFSLRTNARTCTSSRSTSRWVAAEREFIPFNNILPIDRWTNLQHLGISRFFVKQDDLWSCIVPLSPTLRSMELSFLQFIQDSGGYCGLLFNIREELGWGDRPVAEQPKITIHVDTDNSFTEHCFVDISKEVHEFLYNEGKNPFEEGQGTSGSNIRSGVGIQRHVCNPDLDHANLPPELSA